MEGTPLESEEELELEGESDNEAEQGMVRVQEREEPNEPTIPVQEQHQQPKSLINVIAEGEPTIQLPDCMKGRYENDPIFGPQRRWKTSTMHPGYQSRQS